MNQIRNLPEIVDASAAGFKDSSLWEEAKKKSDDAVKKLIDDGLIGTTVTLVCIGNTTAGRKFINYEIQKSIDRGNGILGVQIHHLKNFAGEVDTVGETPSLLTKNNYPIYKYDVDGLRGAVRLTFRHEIVLNHNCRKGLYGI